MNEDIVCIRQHLLGVTDPNNLVALSALDRIERKLIKLKASNFAYSETIARPIEVNIYTNGEAKVEQGE